MSRAVRLMNVGIAGVAAVVFFGITCQRLQAESRERTNEAPRVAGAPEPVTTNAAPAPARPTITNNLELWFYYSTNLQVDENLKALEAVWRRGISVRCRV